MIKNNHYVLATMAACTLLVQPIDSTAARLFSVNPSGATAYTTIAQALNVLRGINQYAPKYDSSSHQILMVKGSATVETINFYGLSNLVDVGDIFTNDGVHLYEVKEVLANGKNLVLNRPIDHIDTWAIASSYSILEQNIIDISKGNFYEDIVLTDVNIVTFRGAGKNRTILHQANDTGVMNMPPDAQCADMSEANVTYGTIDFLKLPPQKGHVVFENLSVHSNTASAFINYNQPTGSTDFKFRNFYYDQSYGNDMIYIVGTGNVEIVDSVLRGTGDGFTFTGLNSVRIDNIVLHDRFIPCLNSWTPAGIRLFDVAKPSSIENSRILVEGMKREGDHAGILIGDTGATLEAPSLTINNLFLSSLNVSPSIKAYGRSQVSIGNSEIVSHHNGWDVQLQNNASMTAVCTTGLDRVSKENGTFSNTCNQ